MWYIVSLICNKGSVFLLTTKPALDESTRQAAFSSDIAEIMQTRKRGKQPLAFVRTYGCQQNVADGEKIKGMLEKMGFGFTDQEDVADFILFNTCAIREHAEDRVFGNLGALKHVKNRNPNLIIAVCGCMTEQKKIADKIKKSFPFVNMTFGPHVIFKFPELLYTALAENERVFVRGEEQSEIHEGIPIRRDGKSHAWVSIMYGCDNFCTYCIVPYVRGREKSRDPDEIYSEVKRLVDEGYKQITLLGQNVNSYGKGLEKEMNFAKLLKRLDSIEGDYRIRFMTSHPKDASRELFDTIAASKHIPHYIHLPFQSGNSRVLSEMNRKYNRDEYIELVKYAREVMPDISITSDVIVGFPGETHEEFMDTISLVEEVSFTSIFIFIFSAREGTKAYDMPDPVTYDEKTKWFRELQQVQTKIAASRCKSMLDTVQRVLVEGRNEKTGKLTGRTDGSVIVSFDGGDELIGEFVDVKITQARNWVLAGEPI